ncbi:hypothetical protein KEM56_004753 [Ascosphaera pollenicola]|nr:hypothetical protein KEM56_004753 [Ascosphaera pollenicola]
MLFSATTARGANNVRGVQRWWDVYSPENVPVKSKKNASFSADTSRLWLLAHYIYIHRYSLPSPDTITAAATTTTTIEEAPDAVFAEVVSVLVGGTSSDVASRLTHSTPAHQRTASSSSVSTRKTPLPAFVRRELETLVNQHSITNLLSQSSNRLHDEGEDGNAAGPLASYALTLLRLFPGRGDEIRMWLYLGSAAAADDEKKVPAIIYFWHATRRTGVFEHICAHSGDVLRMLLPPPLPPQETSDAADGTQAQAQAQRQQEWTVILVFLELYTFLLKVLDDEEFFSAGTHNALREATRSWTQESSLPLADVKILTIFLKNLAFTLYWNAAELTASPSSQGRQWQYERSTSGRGLGSYFGTTDPSTPQAPAPRLRRTRAGKATKLAGVTGIPLDYLKGLVTGLLRMVHERDSRRRFLPEG